MDVTPQATGEKQTVTVLVTGANSGLGFAICCRLIDEFLLTRPQSQTLHLLFSTRDAKKGADALARLNAHLQKTLRVADGRTAGVSLLLEARIQLENVLVDLTQLWTVKALAKQLVERGETLHALVWNAGIAGWTHVDYPRALRDVGRSIARGTTAPEYMVCDVGLMAGPQRPPGTNSNQTTTRSASKLDQPRLAKVFAANVFGHYLLSHWLAPVLSGDTRIIWISSTGAQPHWFSLDDIQGSRSHMAYESSKRLTDLLVLTSELPSTRRSVSAFLPTSSASDPHQSPSSRPKMYLTHPGVIGTSIAGLNWFMSFWMIFAMYLSRWLGSPWHPVDPYKGAVSAVFAVLAPPSQLAEREYAEGKGKWGSACDVGGNERVARTEVEGWGYGGQVGVVPSGSVPIACIGNKPTDREMREGFEELGQRVWSEMEALRVEWENNLGGAVDSADSVDV